MSDPSAVITTITGRAWLTGTAQFFLDPEDSLPEGLYL
ncbi:proline racemase family protein [Stenotrophomonas sp. NPDC087984]